MDLVSVSVRAFISRRAREWAVVIILLSAISLPAREGEAGAAHRQVSGAMVKPPPHLTGPQWIALFRAAARRIATLHLQATIRVRARWGKGDAKSFNNSLKQEEQSGKLSIQRQHRINQLPPIPGWTAPGWTSRTTLVRINWDIPAGLHSSRSIQLWDLPPQEQKLLGAGGPSPVEIWVVGRRLEWHAYPTHGTWMVRVGKKSSAYWVYRRMAWWSLFGFLDLEPVVNPLAPEGTREPPTVRQLLSQKYDRATRMIELIFRTHFQGGPRVVKLQDGRRGWPESRYFLKLRGGLRLYRRVEDLVTPAGHLPGMDYDFKGFKKSNGVWFPTKIRERMWYVGRGLLTDETIAVKHLVVNKTFAPGTFQYKPPFGAMVTDLRTSQSYYVGARNPLFPPSTRGGKANVRKGGQ